MKTTPRRALVAAAALATVLVAAGVAYATIPDSSGAIDGCYAIKDGSLRVIDTAAGQSCDAKREVALDWSQAGLQGVPGAQGAPGAPGPSGPSVVIGSSGSAAADVFDQFVGFGSVDASFGTVAAPMPRAGTASHLFVDVSPSPGGLSNDVDTFTLYVDGGKQPIACEIVGTASSCSDTTDSVSIAAGDTVALYAQTDQASNVPRVVTFSFEVS